MDADAVIAEIKKLPPEERGKVEAYVRHPNGTSESQSDEHVASPGRLDRFRTWVSRVPARPGPDVATSRDSIYD